jgi:blue copper oxidase
MNRRDFLKKGGMATALGLLAPSIILESCRKSSMQMNSFSQVKVVEGLFNTSLPIPSMVNASSINSLTAQRTTASIIKNKTTNVYGYHNSILGPFIKVNNGDAISINFTNNLSDETNVHWHGLIVPQNMDGHPDNVVSGGGSYQYNFSINQRAGMYWYHPHPNMKTAQQAYMGLAGFFIVNDSEEAALNLPSGNYELPIVIQDKRFHPDYSLNYSPSMMDVMNGYFGQYIVVNGVYSPSVDVATRWYRVRVLNGSTARIYNLALSNGAPLNIIGSDAGLLNTPESVSSILLAPGERIDLLIDFSTYTLGTEIFLQSNSFNGANVQGEDSFKIMKFKISEQITDSFALPTSLSVIAPIPISQATATRTWVLGGMNMGGGMNGNMGGMSSGSGDMNMQMLHTINNKTYKSNEILASVNAGSTEIWEIDNSKNTEIHPMHIHGVQFQILERTGGRNSLIASEKGWKDTILLMPNEKVKLIMTFPQNKGKYLIHCHNLEHEDSGMMVNFEIK